MIDIKSVIFQIKATKIEGTPVLFENTKRSFLLLGRMLKNLQTRKKFTYSTVIKMMSSRCRATKEETMRWLDMLVAENILLKASTPPDATNKAAVYYMFTGTALSLKKEVFLSSLIIN
ncbi:hypothetical protein NECID01_1795 [Nematocida sp. AWRm77]|nr:hypothetical protein NECID01_1795 [Nematocida sp. AWRm77]